MKAGWQTKPFEDCIKKVTYTTKIQRKDFLPEGTHPIVSQEEDFINGYWNNEADLFKVETPVTIFGDHTKILKYITFDFVLGADGVKILPPLHFLEPKFFFYQLQTANLESLGYARHYKLLKELKIVYPSRAEQQRIVAILDQAFEGIAKARANAEQNLQNSRALFESHLQSVFSVRGEPVEPHHPSTSSGRRGEGWVEKPLSEICDIRHGFAFDGAEFSSNVTVGNPIIVTPGNFTEDGKLLFNERNTKRFSGEPPAAFRFDIDDLVIVMTDLSSKMKILGKPAFVETKNVLHNQRVGRIVFRDTAVEKRFVYYFMMSESFLKSIKSSATGTMVKHTAPTRILNNVISYPFEQVKQLEVIAKIDALREETQRLETIYKRKIALLDELKKSLLQQAFSGEL